MLRTVDTKLPSLAPAETNASAKHVLNLTVHNLLFEYWNLYAKESS